MLDIKVKTGGNIDIGKQMIDFKCPKCGRVKKFSLNDAKMGRTISCICGQKIKLTDEGTVKKGIDSVNKSLKDFQKALKQLEK